MSLRILQLNSARLFVGESAHTLNLTKALRDAGHQVWLGLREGFTTIEMAQEKCLEPIGLKMSSKFRPGQDFSDLKKIANLVRKNKIQIIHAHRGKDHWQAVLANKLFNLKVPVIRTRHVVTPLKDKAANRWQAKRTAKLIVVSSAIEADVRSKPVYSAEKILKIPGALDVKDFDPKADGSEIRKQYNIPDDALLVIYSARFARVKAHNFLLEAWKEIQEQFPNAWLFLLGWHGELKQKIRDQIKEEKIRAVLDSARGSDEARKYLAAADIGILCSIGSEGFSRSVLEYMAMAMPVIGTHVGAVPDLIEDGVNGKLIEPRSSEAIAAALKEVLSADEGQRKGWGAAGRAKVEQEFCYPVWVKAHENVYEEVLSSK